MADERPLSASEIAGNSGSLPEIRWNGKTWRVAHCCPAVLQIIESEVVREAYENLDKAKRSMPVARFAGLVERLDNAILTGQHQYGEPLHEAASNSIRGKTMSLWGCIAAVQPEFTRQDAIDMMRDEPQQVKEAFAKVEPSFLDHLARSQPVTRAQVQAFADQARASMG